MAGSTAVMRGRVRDINGKGMQLSVPLPLPEQAPIHLHLLLDGVLDLDLEAESPWQITTGSDHCYGLRFTRIPDQDRARIYDYVRTTFPEQMRQQWWS